ncbi:hypothetical protein [Ideonella sp.]|uniref:hypothetical protein n=1 Tax=Ideonella sp. TaxID=1929293 RepID=UPI0035AF07D9
MSKTNSKIDRGDIAIWIAVVLTVVWILGIVVFLHFNWSKASAMPPNEWGDFLAGFFAPLAFIWLALGYFLQRRQLTATLKAFEDEKTAVDFDRRWREESASPRLSLEPSGGSIGPERCSRGFRVTNYGGHAIKLTLKIDGDVDSLRRWDACGQGETVDFNWETQVTPRTVDAVISMVDVLGRRHRCRFVLIVEEGGSIRHADVRNEPA